MVSNDEKKKMLSFAKDVTIDAGRITLEHYGKPVKIERKADDSPVTIADKKTEEYIRSRIHSKYSTHSILGEEFEEQDTGSEFQWVIDPIDGTSSYIRKVPLYSVLLSLQHNEVPILGVIHIPVLNETVYAAKGVGCFHNGEICRVSSTSELSKAWVHATDFADLKRRRPDFTERLLNAVNSCRTWGDGYGYLLVATGRADVMIDPVMHPWDIAPLSPIILEAGGVFTDLDGEPNTMGSSALACNKYLHKELMRLI